MTQEGLTAWLEHRGWYVRDQRAAWAADAPSAPPRDISILAVPPWPTRTSTGRYTLSIQAADDVRSVPGDAPGTATRVEVAAWRGRSGSITGGSQGHFLPLVGNDVVPSVTFPELETVAYRLEQGDV